MKWEQGRQGTGYKKLKLFELGNKLLGGVDAYLLKYEVNDSVPVHTDVVDGKAHYRLNFELVEADMGGELFIENPIFRFGRLSIFRSDLSRHAVHPVVQGKRVVLSIGLAI